MQIFDHHHRPGGRGQSGEELGHEFEHAGLPPCPQPKRTQGPTCRSAIGQLGHQRGQLGGSDPDELYAALLR
jgi:hypothetical protein